jgi:hypothetical protein
MPTTRMLVAGADRTAPTNRDAMRPQPYSNTGTSRVIGAREAPARARLAVDFANRYTSRAPQSRTIRICHWSTHTARGSSVIRSTAKPMRANARTAQLDAFTIALRSPIEV